VFINEGIIQIIKGAVDIVNWFVRLYNKSVMVRGAVQNMIAGFKNLWAICKFVLKQIVNSFKGLGSIIEGIVTFDFDKIKKGYTESFKAMGKDLVVTAKEIGKNTADAFNNTMNDQLNEVSIDLNANLNPNGVDGKTKNTGTYKAPGKSKEELAKEKKEAEKQQREAEKHAKEVLKLINDTEEAKVNAMEEGHEKELALIKLKYQKKLSEIKGQSEQEEQLRMNLALAMEKEIADSNQKYEEQRAKANFQLKLATVKKDSEEEKDLKLEQLEAERKAEIEAAKKTGADVNLINEKYAAERSQIEIDYQNAQYEKQADIRAGEFEQQQAERKTQYGKDLKALGNNEEAKTKLTEKYEKDMAEMSEKYAVDSAQAQVDMLEKMLSSETLTDSQREELAKKLAAAKTALANATADADIAATERAAEADQKSWEKRISNASYWLQKVSEMLNAVNDLASAIYDGKIQQIEDEQDALDEASEAEQDRITDLVDKKVITEEEGEARKRAAEAKTAKKNEELEKKKADLEYRQAVWDKANSVAQCGINTALALMQLWVKPGWPAAIPMMSVVGALGALQLATILATPIPKYAKGTKFHQGGMAIVGDGGQPEVVSYDGQTWVTPSTPTMVDLPKGATVMPSLNRYLLENPDVTLSPVSERTTPVIVNNDYAKLERGISTLATLIKKQTRQQHIDSYQAQYELFKARI
jgi:hypothetical protein